MRKKTVAPKIFREKSWYRVPKTSSDAEEVRYEKVERPSKPNDVGTKCRDWAQHHAGCDVCSQYDWFMPFEFTDTQERNVVKRAQENPDIMVLKQGYNDQWVFMLVRGDDPRDMLCTTGLKKFKLWVAACHARSPGVPL